jgi:hypothetical protein
MHIFRNGNPESLQLNAQIGMVVRDWEAAICDLRDMSGITIAIVDEALRGAPDQEEHLSIPPPTA